MKKTPPNEFRVRTGRIASTDEDGMLGVFRIPLPMQVVMTNSLYVNPAEKNICTVVVNDDRFDKKWEHVSVSLTSRCPTWEEMCYIKSLFWEDEETAVQFHPKKSEYKNLHPYCLHMWRDTTKEHELPPSIYVAP